MVNNFSSAQGFVPDMVSVIIPTLNETGIIEFSLPKLLCQAGNFEVIVADGGSSDGTLDILSQFPQVKKVTSAKGRAHQMNEGAKIARGDIFLYLHADTYLPCDAFRLIREALSDSAVSGGSFCLRFDHPHLFLWILAMLSRMNYPFATYGDQGLFLRSSTFRRIGGFKVIPIMEDLEIQKRLRGLGKFLKIKKPVITSARRYFQNGILRQQILNMVLVTLYHLGVSPHMLKRYYCYQRNSE
jgi:rSAM/selenodomain-associated transferase 2